MSFKNIKIQIFRVILTCDRRYKTFELKKKRKKHYIEDLIFKNFKNKSKNLKKKL